MEKFKRKKCFVSSNMRYLLILEKYGILCKRIETTYNSNFKITSLRFKQNIKIYKKRSFDLIPNSPKVRKCIKN